MDYSKFTKEEYNTLFTPIPRTDPRAMPLESWLPWQGDVTRGMFQLTGGTAVKSVTIQDGAITPQDSFITVRTEGAALQDDLEKLNISIGSDSANIAGMELKLSREVKTQTINIIHSVGLGGLRTFDGENLTLPMFPQFVVFKRQGDSWLQIKEVTIDTGVFDDIKTDISTLQADLATLSDSIPRTVPIPNVIVTVGSSGNFQTINQAVDYLVEKYLPRWNLSGIQAQVTLLPDFVMKNRLECFNVNLGWITIVGEGHVDGSPKTVNVDNSLNVDNQAWFYGVNATLPNLGCLFNCINQGTVLDGRHGVHCNKNSKVFFHTKCGINNSSGSNLVIVSNSNAETSSCSFSGSLGNGVLLNLHSRGNFTSANISNNKLVGIYADVGCDANISFSSIINNLDTNILSAWLSRVLGNQVVATGGGNYGVLCGVGGRAAFDTINAQKGAVASTSDFAVLTDGHISLSGTVVGGYSQAVTTWTANGRINKV